MSTQESNHTKLPYILLSSVVGLLNIIIALMVGMLLTDFREFKAEIRTSITILNARNVAQDEVASQFREVRAEQFGKIESRLEQIIVRLEKLENK